jgi:uncharacterized protein (DUF302 family)
MSTAVVPDRDIVRIASSHSVVETLDRLESALKARNVKVFARIDFSGDASAAGLTLRPEQMLIFGNPKAGTPLMVANPEVGIDLPLKALAWQDEAGKVWLAYNAPEYIVGRHRLASSFSANLGAVTPLLAAAAQ